MDAVAVEMKSPALKTDWCTLHSVQQQNKVFEPLAILIPQPVNS